MNRRTDNLRSCRKLDQRGTKQEQIENTGGGLRPAVDDNRLIDDDELNRKLYG